MQPVRRRAQVWPAIALFTALAIALAGCASPGPPRAPSLEISRLVSDLSATRSGDAVALRFTVPTRTTDGQPLREATLKGSLCRQAGNAGPCVPVDAAETHAPVAVPTTIPAPPLVWTDELPASLRTGPPRAIAYRIELRNAAGRSAGLSDPVYAAAGASPPAITGLLAEGTRLGIELRWTPVPGAGEVLLDRMGPVTGEPSRPPNRQAKTTKATRPGRPGAGGHESGTRETGIPGLVILQAAPGDLNAAATLDTSIEEGVPYRYTAFRREIVQLGGRTLEMRSAPSAGITSSWRDIYPPPTPTGLTAVGYLTPADTKPAAYAVDLVWQPVEYTRLAGYLVYRQRLETAGEPSGPRDRLTGAPVLTPGYHDATALPDERYRYSVTAVDPRGNESPAADTSVDPAPTP